MSKRTRASRDGSRGGRAALKVSLTSIASDEDTGDDAPSCEERWDILQAELSRQDTFHREQARATAAQFEAMDARFQEMEARLTANTAEIRELRAHDERIDRQLRELQGKRMLPNAAFHPSVAAGLDWAEEAWIAADDCSWTN